MNKEPFLERFRLSGKVALVTGGSRGIGKAIALGLAEAGADVIVASRKLSDLEKVAQEVAQLGRKSLAVAANLRNLPEIKDLIKRAVEEFGHIDILVNNAGTNAVFGSVFNVNEKAWDVTLGLNLKGSFFLSQAVAEVMRNQSGGNIINIASIDGLRPRLGSAVYSISKAGVIMLTQALAQEWAQYNIRVNAIAPGLLRTKFSEALWKNPLIAREYENNTALGHIGEPEDVVATALLLASEASSYMTGQTIAIDGGHFCSIKALRSIVS